MLVLAMRPGSSGRSKPGIDLAAHAVYNAASYSPLTDSTGGSRDPPSDPCYAARSRAKRMVVLR